MRASSPSRRIRSSLRERPSPNVNKFTVTTAPPSATQVHRRVPNGTQNGQLCWPFYFRGIEHRNRGSFSDRRELRGPHQLTFPRRIQSAHIPPWDAVGESNHKFCFYPQAARPWEYRHQNNFLVSPPHF